MSTLAESAALDECSVRLEKLTPDAARQWGKMTPHQMVCHLADAFRMATGERSPADASNLLTRSVVRLVALHTALPWPKGVATLPEVDQVAGGGTPPEEWSRDVDALRGYISSFAELQDFSLHPIFGKLSRAEWMVWGYRHVDHHFRQFGV